MVELPVPGLPVVPIPLPDPLIPLPPPGVPMLELPVPVLPVPGLPLIPLPDPLAPPVTWACACPPIRAIVRSIIDQMIRAIGESFLKMFVGDLALLVRLPEQLDLDHWESP